MRSLIKTHDGPLFRFIVNAIAGNKRRCIHATAVLPAHLHYTSHLTTTAAPLRADSILAPPPATDPTDSWRDTLEADETRLSLTPYLALVKNLIESWQYMPTPLEADGTKNMLTASAVHDFACSRRAPHQLTATIQGIGSWKLTVTLHTSSSPFAGLESRRTFTSTPHLRFANTAAAQDMIGWMAQRVTNYVDRGSPRIEAASASSASAAAAATTAGEVAPTRRTPPRQTRVNTSKKEDRKQAVESATKIGEAAFARKPAESSKKHAKPAATPGTSLASTLSVFSASTGGIPAKVAQALSGAGIPKRQLLQTHNVFLQHLKANSAIIRNIEAFVERNPDTKEAQALSILCKSVIELPRPNTSRSPMICRHFSTPRGTAAEQQEIGRQAFVAQATTRDPITGHCIITGGGGKRNVGTGENTLCSYSADIENGLRSLSDCFTIDKLNLSIDSKTTFFIAEVPEATRAFMAKDGQSLGHGRGDLTNDSGEYELDVVLTRTNGETIAVNPIRAAALMKDLRHSASESEAMLRKAISQVDPSCRRADVSLTAIAEKYLELIKTSIDVTPSPAIRQNFFKTIKTIRGHVALEKQLLDTDPDFARQYSSSEKADVTKALQALDKAVTEIDKPEAEASASSTMRLG